MPMVLTCANRSISAPISIWNDHQDSFSARDAGWIQLFAENNQELMDLHILAYRLSEDRRVTLPVMVCMDGFMLTHAYEPLWVPSQEQVDAFLPPYQPRVYLTAKDPMSFGELATPEYYMETRYSIQQAQERALEVIEELAQEFEAGFGRRSGEIVEEYFTEDASTVIISLGSIAGTVKDAVDELREEGVKVGGLKVRVYRPLPAEILRQALGGAERVIVLDKNISLGHTGALASEIRAVLYGQPGQPKVAGFVVGLGGRDITADTIKGLVARVEEGESPDAEFVDLNPEHIWGGEL
jgi:pyruvate ferredoxin oxidoreductase alpha subunit